MQDLIIASIPEVAVTVAPEWAQKQVSFLRQTAAITVVNTPETQQQAVSICREINAELREIERARKALTEKPLKIQRDLMRVKNDACAPLEKEVERIGKLDAEFQRKERERVEAERKLREQEEAKKARELADAQVAAEKAKQAAEQAKPTSTAGQPDDDLNHAANLALLAEDALEQKRQELKAIIAQPPPAAAKATGTIERDVPKFEITDHAKVYARFPHFYDLAAGVRRKVINDTIHPGFICDGMKVWVEKEITYRAAR